MLQRKVSMSGRTLWLGGTDVAKHREASQFNCSFTEVETVYDVVDSLWLLLQGKL
jgi:ribonucleoside-triphosphate reductase